MDMVYQGETFQNRGNKVSLRRWFSWIAAAHRCGKSWHAILLVMVCMGQLTGVYKSWRDVPIWSNIPTKVNDADDDDDDIPDGLQEDGDGEGGDGADAAAAADAVRAAADNVKERAVEDHGPMKEKHQPAALKQLYKECKNTLGVAGSILGMDGIRQKTLIIVAMCRPIWTQHSADARDCRSREDTMKHYLDASQYGAMKSVNESAAVLMDLQTLQSIGFDTTFGVGLPSGLKVVDDVVQSQSALAHRLVQMFASVAFHRITSMLWHTASWPGLLAGLCSESVDVVDKTFVKLLDDYRIFLVAKTNAESNSLIGKLVRASPFKGRVMREI